MRTEDVVLSANGQQLAATKVYPASGPEDAPEPTVLTLHGLGVAATRHSVRYILDHLAEHGHASMCFEFSGNGDSTGVFAEGSPRRRRGEVLAAAGQLSREHAPVLIGTSMGAHLAAWTTPVLRPRGLVLFAPVTYPGDSADRRFDGHFADPGDYDDSTAYAGVREFDGDLLIVAATEDQVAPAAVVDGYLRHARKARSKRVIWLDGFDHYIHRRLPQEEALRAEVQSAILQIVSGA